MTNLLIFLERWIQLRTTNMCIKAGQILAGLSLGGWGIIAAVVGFSDFQYSFEFSLSNQPFLAATAGVIGILLLIVGAFLPVQAAKSTIVTLMGIPGVSLNVPDKSVGKPYSLYNPHQFNMNLDKYNPEVMVEKLNTHYRYMIDDHIINDTKNGKIFFAGLARVPCLFAAGTLFRSSSVEVEPLERFRNPDGWRTLGIFEKNPNQYSVISDPSTLVSRGREIGIAVSLTDEVLPQQIPEFIREHCVHIKLEPETKREAILTLPELHAFTKKFKTLLDKCSKVADVIHLFICAQSAVAFQMGRSYQEGMHSKVVVHNFTPGEGYSWSLVIDKGMFIYNELKSN